MLGKLAIAACVVLPAFGVTHAGALRQLYDAMYPVDTLKRYAFDLCHASSPTFVRALRADREACYHHMPQSIALAIGLVRPPAEPLSLAALGQARGPAVFAQAAPPTLRRMLRQPRRLAAFIDLRHATARGCGSSAGPDPQFVRTASGLLAQHGAAIDDASLATLIRRPRSDVARVEGARTLPTLSLSLTLPGQAREVATSAVGRGLQATLPDACAPPA